ncbi:tetraacyldisaccharide 4'-kinase [Neotamlana laminarinivorans]|uniref:Tetraacyldisaccharide 4'-kinase n=1 Tax=Neotamlana laminarinivorans TaxID=2883124 RepID=A0A9X1L3V2_9FLAO|nr:tetraacyldisaccharide 4'-kinase [Tamlana laminarinivorans]MCB4798854.1 tetraacyldisaccharide 4'-kinase [Tamlana laminarinivorans]
MKFLRYILFPVVPVYFFITWLRNWLYDLNIKSSKSYNLPVICVGNLSVGGTGKSPMIEYLINVLKTEFKVATLSRGYKRETDGFQLANSESTVKTLGDEPFQFFNKFKDDIRVAVDANRQNGIESLLNLTEAPNIILLDDAYQHRKVKAGFNILLTTYYKPYFNNIVLPTGDLREPKSGAKRADVIVVTKCPEQLLDADKQIFINKIKPTAKQEVFFSEIVYSDKVYSQNASKLLKELISQKFTLVTGIANPMPLVNYLNSQHLKFNHLNYSDHYNFKAEDIIELQKEQLILTTEKDFMRLKGYGVLKTKLFYLPITVKLDREKEFVSKLKNFAKR